MENGDDATDSALADANNGNDKTSAYVPPNQLEQTLAIVKPDAIDKADEIVSVIHREGFAVLQVHTSMLIIKHVVKHPSIHFVKTVTGDAFVKLKFYLSHANHA